MRLHLCIIAILLAIAMTCCKRVSMTVEEYDFRYIDSIAVADAKNYIELPERESMKRLDYLLWVKSREGQLKEEVGEAYATRYLEVFTREAALDGQE